MDLLFQVNFDLLDQVYLFVNHVVDALAHCTVALLAPLGLLMPLVPLLGAESASLATAFHHLFIGKVLLFVGFEVLLDICGYFSQVL